MEDSKVVKSIATKSGGKSGTYWTVTWQDGKRDNIFNAKWLPLLEQSQKDNRLLHFTKEKKGDFYNIVSLELAELEKVSEKLPLETSSTVLETASTIPPKPIPPMSKDAQIERAVWIKELGECIRSGTIGKLTPFGRVLHDAYFTEMLRVIGTNIKEVPEANYLVEEAKKLGFIDTKKGG